MVFLTLMNLARNRGPDEFWRKRRIFRLAAHYIDRRRNCYSSTIRAVLRALVSATKGRRQRRKDTDDLWNARIEAAARSHNTTSKQIHEGLDLSGVELNAKSLSNLAAWEPRSFSALAALAKLTCRTEKIKSGLNENYTGTNLQYRLFIRRKDES